jgi:thioredoxin-like negative regulator of GroEL
MSFILCAALMQVALSGGEPPAANPPVSVKAEAPAPAETAKQPGAEAEPSYAEAHRVTEKTGKPLVVMVGADWCGPCQNMRRAILPRVREHGFFRRIAFAHVNVDRERDLAKQLTGGGAVPQLVMYRKTKDGWKQRKMIGGHSVEEVEKFINDGLAQDADEHSAPSHAARESSGSHSTTSTDQSSDDQQHG